jgi:hypothetical protein
MRRTLVVLGVLLVVGTTSGRADAGSLKVRTDPNDSASNLDIRAVTTHLSSTTMYLRLGSWDRFRIRDMRETWGFSLDTVGSHKMDRWVGIYPSPHGLKCDVREGPHGSTRSGYAMRPAQIDDPSRATSREAGSGTSIGRSASGPSSKSPRRQRRLTMPPTMGSIAGSDVGGRARVRPTP